MYSTQKGIRIKLFDRIGNFYGKLFFAEGIEGQLPDSFNRAETEFSIDERIKPAAKRRC